MAKARKEKKAGNTQKKYTLTEMAVALSNYVVDNETGEYIDIRDDTLSHYEKGDRPIPVFILCAYADYLGIDVQSLIPDMKNYKFF